MVSLVTLENSKYRAKKNRVVHQLFMHIKRNSYL
jgi:hypothetical protein